MSRPLVDIRLEALATRGGVPPGLIGISVHIRYGEFFTFLGPPHSGKTDVVRAVAGFMTPSAGRVLVDGQDVGVLAPGARPRAASVIDSSSGRKTSRPRLPSR